ncbi:MULTISPECIES: hypothetical protein [unclassified Caballeronia]|uniref:hypothetical protein n=1 Tax=unclassified Caballeronia TaxID=2646786 RepID=UPI002865CDDD|nr:MULTISPECIES: hypothetical protein [unclassified Caballeronia]MDR5740265.1 hypothetical protein [Caballeronia sp. LZ016]MDR5808555.1 hypothetical protein [Caballeronia sp. LZ019]
MMVSGAFQEPCNAQNLPVRAWLMAGTRAVLVRSPVKALHLVSMPRRFNASDVFAREASKNSRLIGE